MRKYSYSAKQADVVYSDVLADHFGLPAVNIARAGSNNDRIFRSTVEAVLDCLQHGRLPFVIMAMSFVRRQEVWVTDLDSVHLAQVKESFPPQESHHLILPTTTLERVIDRDPWKQRFQSLVVEDFFVHKKLLDFYQNLFLFTSFLKLHKVPYLIFSGAKNDDCPIECFPAIRNLQLVESVKKDPWILDIHDHSIMKWAKANDQDCDSKTGHLSQKGHRMYGQWLITLIGETHGT
jgi:hypothetical protein